MPTTIFVLLFRFLVAAVSRFVGRSRAAKPKPLCAECASAHIQYGACGRRVVSCTLGGGVRAMKLDVLYCTDFSARTLPVRPAIGFVRKIPNAE